MTKEEEQLLNKFLQLTHKPDLKDFKSVTKVGIGDRTFYCVDLSTDNLAVFNEDNTYIGIVAGDGLDILFNDS